MKKKCYYAHGIHTYDTEVEKTDIQWLKSLGFKVENPNQHKHIVRYNKKGMAYYEAVVKKCDVLAFRSFRDNKIGAGVAQEIIWMFEVSKPIIEIPILIDSKRFLPVKETRHRIRQGTW